MLSISAAATDMAGAAHTRAPTATQYPIEVVMPPAKPEVDFDRPYASVKSQPRCTSTVLASSANSSASRCVENT